MYIIRTIFNNFSIILYKTFHSVLVIAVFSGWLYAEAEQAIILNPGLNHVSIKVLNNSNVDFKSIKIIIEEEKLPEGFSILEETQNLDVAAKSKTEQGLMLKINVDANTEQGTYKLPFILKDTANHSWSYAITVKLEDQNVQEYDILPNYPNPFNADTNIKYILVNDQLQRTQLTVFDLSGNHIRTLIDKKQLAGVHSVTWDGKDDAGVPVASGFYFYKITSGSFNTTRKMLLLK